MITTAFVKIWNTTVGAVAWDPEAGIASFEYTPAFAAGVLNVAPIKMPLIEAQGRIFVFPELRNTPTFKGLPGLLADVLPDKYGNRLINVWLARNGRPADSLNPVELLCFTGKRGMGALEFEPVEPRSIASATKIELESLVQIATEILTGKEDFSSSLANNEEKALLDILKVGSSAGGARAKALIAFNPLTRVIRSGQTDAPVGYSHWMIKFDGVSDNEIGITHGYGRVEMAYYLMALDCGIDMMECRLFEEHGRAHFMTRRFDRPDGKSKIHVQSFCALNHYDFNDIVSYSYEQLFETMRVLRLPYPQAEQLYRRMVFNVLARNCDDHTKNFAFMMDRTGSWSLAPAFDVCHSFRPGSTWVSQHSLSVNGKRKDIDRNDLLEVASKMNIKKAKAIIDHINQIVMGWEVYADRTSVPDDLKKAIGKTLLNL